MSLALASLRAQPTRHIPMTDGRRIGVAACTLTCGTDVVALVAPELLDAFEVAREDLAATPGGQYRLTLSTRADGHLEIHSVDTTAVLIDAGRCAHGTTVLMADIVDGERALARLAA